MNKLLILIITIILLGCGNTLSQKKLEAYSFCWNCCARERIDSFQQYEQQKSQLDACKRLCFQAIK